MEARIILLRRLVLLTLVALGAGCDQFARDAEQPVNGANAMTVDVPQAVEPLAGVTPMGERVAVLGLLNKRNGIVRDITMKPGQAIRFRDAVVPRIDQDAFDPPWMRDLARAERLDERTTRTYLKRLARTGELHQVVPDLFYSAQAIERLARIACDLA